MLETAHSLHCYHGHQAKIIAFISMSDSYFIFFIFTFSLKVRIFQATFFFLLFFFFTLSLTALSLYSSWKKSRTFLGGEDGVPKWSCQKARSEWHNPFCICKWNESSLTTLFDFFSGLLFTFLLLFPPSSLAFF